MSPDEIDEGELVVHKKKNAAVGVRGAAVSMECGLSHMGVTQHRNSVNTIKEIVNVALSCGDIGNRRAGLCPVQGIRTYRAIGQWESGRRCPEVSRRIAE